MKTIKRDGRTLVPMGTVWCKKTLSLLVEYRAEGEVLSSRVSIIDWNLWTAEYEVIAPRLAAERAGMADDEHRGGGE